ncbi:Hint domain-containing protein [Gemmobacter caeruleus]|uniref:Hint domain-containing protein n=1 Tax=Gemmobacter caeruleus TaxID=2595004 RepID=UPI001EEFC900|nr:Hint domain-containing protein [Gemmobacter caeruleus]
MSAGAPVASVAPVSLQVAPEDAPAGTTVQEVTVTFHDVAPGTYRLFAGETNSGDGEALRVAATDGMVTEVICSGPGTLILTPAGDVPVQDLAVGDLVQTRDNGLQAIRWIGSRRLCRDTLARQDKLRPVRIGAGTLGEGVPAADLLVSPQHRVMLRSRIAVRMFGVPEVLCPARHLLALPGIEIAGDLDEVTYTHLLFDQHEVVFSNGAETESLFTGPEAIRSVSPEQRAEILAIFPDLPATRDRSACCRTVITGRQGRKLVERHQRNRKPMVEDPPPPRHTLPAAGGIAP